MITLVCRGWTCNCLVEDNRSGCSNMDSFGDLYITHSKMLMRYKLLMVISSHTLQALLYKKYSTDSDVWSYGMVLFEIWSVAKKPFASVTNTQVLRLVQTGFCQAPPPGCPRAIYELMVDCW